MSPSVIYSIFHPCHLLSHETISMWRVILCPPLPLSSSFLCVINLSRAFTCECWCDMLPYPVLSFLLLENLTKCLIIPLPFFFCHFSRIWMWVYLLMCFSYLSSHSHSFVKASTSSVTIITFSFLPHFPSLPIRIVFICVNVCWCTLPSQPVLSFPSPFLPSSRSQSYTKSVLPILSSSFHNIFTHNQVYMFECFDVPFYPRLYYRPHFLSPQKKTITPPPGPYPIITLSSSYRQVDLLSKIWNKRGLSIFFFHSVMCYSRTKVHFVPFLCHAHSLFALNIHNVIEILFVILILLVLLP